MTDGRRKKYQNRVVSSAFLILSGVLMWTAMPTIKVRLISAALALIWANFFEYAYHRWADHTPGTIFERAHRKHHADPHDEDHHALGGTVWMTIGMFLVNFLPVAVLDALLHIGFAGPVLWAFAVYVILVEEVHWRAHTGEWIPDSWRSYHMSHHKRPLGRYNIFIPLFDWVLGTL